MKLDILAVGVHPDDVELGVAGTILAHQLLGYKCGILDLTRGEMGTRGNAELRLEEAQRAAKILNVEVRENLGFADAFFTSDKQHLIELIKRIRHFQPEIVICNATSDRHPDHGRAGKLVSDACFYSGLIKIETEYKGVSQEAWRPKVVYHYIQDRHQKPDLLVDITPHIDKKFEAIQAFSSQFYNPGSDEPETSISSKEFLEVIKSRSMDFGRHIGVTYAEGFKTERYLGVRNLFDLI